MAVCKDTAILKLLADHLATQVISQ